MSKKVIHVIEDDEASAASMRALLLSTGCDVEVYASAENFLARKDRAAGNCLIIDVRLEGMSGIDLLKTLLAQGNSTPAIIISGHADAAIRKQALANGALAVLEKPFDAGQLLQWVDNATSDHSDQHAG